MIAGQMQSLQTWYLTSAMHTTGSTKNINTHQELDAACGGSETDEHKQAMVRPCNSLNQAVLVLMLE